MCLRLLLDQTVPDLKELSQAALQSGPFGLQGLPGVPQQVAGARGGRGVSLGLGRMELLKVLLNFEDWIEEVCRRFSEDVFVSVRLEPQGLLDALGRILYR